MILIRQRINFSLRLIINIIKMNIVRVDHFVLTVQDIDETAQFYSSVLGMRIESFKSGGVHRTALRFGDQKINLHQLGNVFKPGAERALPGSGDFCLISDTPVSQIANELDDLGIPIVEGPVRRTGATGPLDSIYIRDPDKNLIEISNLVLE